MTTASYFFDDGTSRKFWAYDLRDPIAGDGDIFSISLTPNPGCIYFWNHEAPDGDDEDGDGIVHYKMSHATLVAGSFHEFLTRISKFTDESCGRSPVTAVFP